MVSSLHQAIIQEIDRINHDILNRTLPKREYSKIKLLISDSHSALFSGSKASDLQVKCYKKLIEVI